MGRKKKTLVEIQLPQDEGQEPLSDFQDVSKTGRTDATDYPENIFEKPKPKKKGIEIRSAELVDQMFCNYKYKHTVGPNTTNTVSTKSEVPVHYDLVGSFRKLDAHLALICEEVEEKLIGDINDIDHEPTSDRINKFTVTKFSLDGSEDAMSVVLSGLKELSTGESIKLETPKIALDASYPFAMELTSTIQDCVMEVEEYMKGKQADNPQLEMSFESDAPYVEEDL